MPDDHSDVVPLLPIPNRTVKRVSADDSAGSRVKVGHRQALTAQKAPTARLGLFYLCRQLKSVPPTSARRPSLTERLERARRVSSDLYDA